MATWLSTSVFPLKVVFFVSSDFSLASFEIVLFLISRCDKYSFIHTTSVEKLNFLSSTKWKQGRLKELAKLTAGYMISSGRRPLSYISMHENAFKKAVAKKKQCMWVITFRSIPLKLVIMMDRGYAGPISNPNPKLSWSYSIRIRVQPRQELFSFLVPSLHLIFSSRTMHLGLSVALTGAILE